MEAIKHIEHWIEDRMLSVPPITEISGLDTECISVLRSLIIDEFRSPSVGEWLNDIGACGSLGVIFPELDEMRVMSTYGHKNVWEHTMKVIDHLSDIPTWFIESLNEPADVESVIVRIRMAAAFHDVGKTKARFYGSVECHGCDRKVPVRERNGTMCFRCGVPIVVDDDFLHHPTFRRHERHSEKMASAALSRLGFEDAFSSSVSRDCALHMLTKGDFIGVFTSERSFSDANSLASGRSSRSTAIENISKRFRDGAEGSMGDMNENVRWLLAICDFSSTRNGEAHVKRVDDLRMAAIEHSQMREHERYIRSLIKPPLDGNELQEMFSMPSGPWIGKTHKKMREESMRMGRSLTREEGIEIAKHIVTNFS